MSAATYRTLRTHLKKLPEPYRTQAIANTDRSILKHKAIRTVKDAVWVAFSWEESPEGYEYWHKFATGGVK